MLKVKLFISFLIPGPYYYNDYTLKVNYKRVNTIIKIKKKINFNINSTVCV